MEPFLKWAGGKRWLATDKHASLFPDRDHYNRYFEPFLGSAAIFYYLNPENGGLLSDTNKDLINTYQVLRDQPRMLFETLEVYNAAHSKEFYYYLRGLNETDPILKAARFIYLNRTCWNGLYRVNLNGEFNVPIGTKTAVVREEDDFEEASLRLAGFKIECCDFEKALDQAQTGDFVFVDPPYTVAHNLNGFIKYNENLFSWTDQVRLRDAVIRAIQRGAKVLVLNADHASIRELYRGVGQIKTLNRKSIIAGKSDARGTYSEVAIRGWTG